MKQYIITVNGKDYSVYANDLKEAAIFFPPMFKDDGWPSKLCYYFIDIAIGFMQFMNTDRCSIQFNHGNCQTTVGK